MVGVKISQRNGNGAESHTEAEAPKKVPELQGDNDIDVEGLPDQKGRLHNGT